MMRCGMMRVLLHSYDIMAITWIITIRARIRANTRNAISSAIPIVTIPIPIVLCLTK
jgi:hypothetical protein